MPNLSSIRYHLALRAHFPYSLVPYCTRDSWSHCSPLPLLKTPPYRRSFLALCFLLFPGNLLAHEVGFDYLVLTIADDGVVQGRFEANCEILEKTFKVQVEGSDGKGDLATAKSTAPKIQDFFRERFQLSADGAVIVPRFTETSFLSEGKALFVQYHFEATLEKPPSSLSFNHNTFYEHEPSHKGGLVLTRNPVNGTEYGEYNLALIFSKDSREQFIDLGKPVTNLLETGSYLARGRFHVRSGLEHLGFLALLALSLVYRPRSQEQQTSENCGWFQLGKLTLFGVSIVTGICVIHALALLLAIFTPISLPHSVAELGMIGALLVAAVHQFAPRFSHGTIILFGLATLAHGLSIPAALGNLKFPLNNLNSASLNELLSSFHLGFLMVHVLAVLVGIVVLWFLRLRSWFVPLCVRGGSAAMLGLGVFLLIAHLLAL